MVGILNGLSDVSLAEPIRGEVMINTSYGSTWRNFEQTLRLMENGAVDAETIVDTSYSVATFEDFLYSETC